MDCRRSSSRCLIMDRAIQWNIAVGFPNTYPLKYSYYIFGGQCYRPFEQLKPGDITF